MAEPVKKKQDQVQQIQIKAEDKELFGAYSTLAQITHSPEEFTVDFFYTSPNPPVGKLVGRVIMSPGHAKRLYKALGDNIRKYEENFGAIREPQVPEPKIGFVN